MPFALTDLIVDFNVIDLVELGYSDEAATPAVVWLDIDPNDVTFGPEWVTLTTQGTTELRRKDRLNAFTVTVNNQAVQIALAKAMLGDPTTTGITGVTARYGFDGKFRDKDYALRLTYKGAVKSTGVAASARYLFHKLHPRQYLPFAGAPANSVTTNVTLLELKRTPTDLLAAPIVGLKDTVKGDWFSLDILT